MAELLTLTAANLAELRADRGVARAVDLAAATRPTGTCAADPEACLRWALSVADLPELLTVKPTGQLTLQADGDGPYVFVGHPTTFDTMFPLSPYYPELQQFIAVGAFDQSLAADPDVVFVFQHDGLPLSHTHADDADSRLTLGVDDVGLTFEARVPRGDQYGSDIAGRVGRGVLREMSISVIVMDYEWMPPDYLTRKMTRLDIHRGDVSVVRFGLNPVTDVRVQASQPAPEVGSAALPADATTLTLPETWANTIAELELLEA